MARPHPRRAGHAAQALPAPARQPLPVGAVAAADRAAHDAGTLREPGARDGRALGDTAESECVLASWLDEVGGSSWRARGPTISLTACRPSIHGWTSWPAARKAHVSRPPTGFPAWPLLPDAPRTVFNDFASTAPALARHPYGLLPPFEVERLPSGPRPSCGRTRPTPRCDARAPSSDTAGSSRSIRNRQDDGAAGEPRERLRPLRSLHRPLRGRCGSRRPSTYELLRS